VALQGLCSRTDGLAVGSCVVGIVDYHLASYFGQRTVTAEASTFLSHTSLSMSADSAMLFLKGRLHLPRRARLQRDSSDDVRCGAWGRFDPGAVLVWFSPMLGRGWFVVSKRYLAMSPVPRSTGCAEFRLANLSCLLKVLGRKVR
jgi:hypothetical protein